MTISKMYGTAVKKKEKNRIDFISSRRNGREDAQSIKRGKQSIEKKRGSGQPGRGRRSLAAERFSAFAWSSPSDA